MALSNTQPNGIKQVIRDVVVIASGSASGTKAIATVDPTKSEIRYLGIKAGDVSLGGSVELTNANTVTGYRINTGSGNSTTLAFEITERW